jgi:hypothetical protein
MAAHRWTPIRPVEVVAEFTVGRTWSGHLTRPDLLTTPHLQVAAFYDASRTLTVAGRQLGSDAWTTVRLPERIQWDSHNHLTLGVDRVGHLHLAGPMHNSPLVYFRTRRPGDVTSFERLPTMVADREVRMSYPRLMHAPDGRLLFSYREGSSGRGSHWFNEYDEDGKSWNRLASVPLLDGEGERSAYPVGPNLGPDGRFHLVWVWRDTADASTNHTVSYARSPDLRSWESARGTAIQLPITLQPEIIVDPVAPGGGVINSNTRVGFDTARRPVIAYHKHDEQGYTQLYNARFEDGAWRIVPSSAWSHRWEFGGGGTLRYDIEIDGIQRLADDCLMQRYFHRHEGGRGALLIDDGSLRGEPLQPPPTAYPPHLDEPVGEAPEIAVRWRPGTDAPGRPGNPRYALRWNSLGGNRDAPRKSWPDASSLIVVGLVGGIPPGPDR